MLRSSLALSLLAASAWAMAPGTAEHIREVGDDYRLDYARSGRATLDVIAPLGAHVEVLDGMKTLATGKSKLRLRPEPGTLVTVAIRFGDGTDWQKQLVAKPGMRAILRVASGRGRTQVTVVEPGGNQVAHPSTGLGVNGDQVAHPSTGLHRKVRRAGLRAREQQLPLAGILGE